VERKQQNKLNEEMEDTKMDNYSKPDDQAAPN
jgi:hypothetical protein